MKTLIGFELRKILGRRMAIAAVGAVLALTLLFAFSTMQGMHAFDGRGEEGSGRAAIALDKRLAKEYGGVLTDEKVQRMMKDFKPRFDLHGMNAKYLYTNAMQSAVFWHFSDLDGNWNGRSLREVYGGEEIRAGYVLGWLSTSRNMTTLFTVLAFVIMLLTAPVFAGEYGGVDSIILTTRFGRTKCAAAKVTAALLAAVLVTLLTAAVNLLPALGIYGTEGLNCSILFAPVGFCEGYIPFNLSCAAVIGYQILLAVMGALAVCGVTLLLSAVCRSPMAALVLAAAVYVLPLLPSVPETSGLYRLVVLTPVYYAQFVPIMSVAQGEGGALYALWAVPAGTAIALLGAIISRRRFAKHQVS